MGLTDGLLGLISTANAFFFEGFLPGESAMVSDNEAVLYLVKV
jgi:hypothetical protein